MEAPCVLNPAAGTRSVDTMARRPESRGACRTLLAILKSCERNRLLCEGLHHRGIFYGDAFVLDNEVIVLPAAKLYVLGPP